MSSGIPRVNKFLISSLKNIRNISTQRHVQEVRIPISSGYIAGKWWGPLDRRPILALHGWQDNCGSFDRLIPLLPEHIPVLAIDSPGHGYSYRLPPGILYHNSGYPIMIKQILNYFGWRKITLMGHSLGAIMSYMYGYLFPQDMDYLICIDGLHPLAHGVEVAPKAITDFLKYDTLNKSKGEPPSYTIEEMVKLLHLATKESVAFESAKYLLHRNIIESKECPGKYYFSRDARLKVGPLDIVDVQQIIKLTSNVSFPLFIGKSTDSPFFGNETMFKQLLTILEESSSDCQVHLIDGKHHVHLNEPEKIAGLITDFIEKHDIDDRNTGGLKPEIVYANICSQRTKMQLC